MTKKTKGQADEVDLYVGARLKDLRSAAGMSQETLAESGRIRAKAP